MKKCNGCEKEIDKYAIACQYCGKLSDHNHEENSNDIKNSDSSSTTESKSD